MTILFQMQTCQIELVDGFCFLRCESSLSGIGYRTNFIRFGIPFQQRTNATTRCIIGTEQVNYDIVDGISFQIYHFIEYLFGGKSQLHSIYFSLFFGYNHQLHFLQRSGIKLQTTILVHIHHEVFSSLLDDTQIAIRHEILYKLLFFIRHQPSKVGLILGIDTGHQFDVWTEHTWCSFVVVIGQTTVPCTTKVTIPPCPLFLTWAKVMTGYMKHSPLRIVFIASLEIVL